MSGGGQDAVANFYSPQTRFWELLCGSLLAWFTLYKNDTFDKIKNKLNDYLVQIVYREKKDGSGDTLSNLLSFFGIFLLAYGFWRINKEISFPGKWALVPVIGSALLLMAGTKAWINRAILSNKIVVWFGLISFPLYLWHWPLLSFARIVEGEVPNRNIRIVAVALSVILAWLTYKFIENPVRVNKHGKTKVTILVIFMAVVGLVGFKTYARDGLEFRNIVKINNFTKYLGWSYWDNKTCASKFDISPCQISNNEFRVMVIGDSHGNHLFPGLVNAFKKEIGVFSGGTCTPAEGITMYVNKNQASHVCGLNDFLSKNFKIIDSNPMVQIVILSSFWRPVLDGNILTVKGRELFGGIHFGSKYPDELGLPPHELIYRGLKRTIGAFLGRNKDVILIRDTPDFEKDIREECSKRFSLGVSLDCYLPRSLFESRRTKENAMFDQLRVDFPRLKILDPFDTLCNSTVCFLVLDGKPLYRDQDHLSVDGSNLLGKAISNAVPSNLVR